MLEIVVVQNARLALGLRINVVIRKNQTGKRCGAALSVEITCVFDLVILVFLQFFI